MAYDLVCGTEVTEAQDAVTADHNGRTYYFCSELCKQDFASDPDHFVSKAKQPVNLKQISNLSKLDRDTRLFIGALFMGLALKTDNLPRAVFAIIGLISTLSSLIGFCPLYKLLDIDTNK
ncbi:MAG: YgaP-like transmembrane domain [Elusimicrobiota bacterium]